jgi:sortase A
MSVWLRAERLAWAVAIGCLGVWGFFRVPGMVGARREIARFEAVRAATPRDTSPDLSLWSPQRIQAWRDALRQPAPPPLGVLRIRRIALEVPVLEGTSEWTLNRAVGHIAETADPDGDGNSGIAGHRDGFFRGLKDVERGDTLELETRRGTHRYLIERTWIVTPDDVSVLDPTSSPAVTLVTCYPFYFVGSAPQRYIVRAVRTASTDNR